MMQSEYLKDRIPAYVIRGLALAITIVFLAAFKVSMQAICVVTVVFVVTGILVELWEYVRKWGFYARLKTALAEVDKKYLLPELLDQPVFYEGKIWVDTLRVCDKSMAENVNNYRMQSREFREYIEMWVHEAKIPVASLRLMCHNNQSDERKMIGQIKRIDDYIENVLYYARSENAERDYIIKEVSLQKVFGGVAVRNREALQALDAQIEASGLAVSVMTDGKWLEFIIGQLLANSLKYYSENRQLVLKVYAEKQDGRVILHFRDNGRGIPESDITYVFEKSFTGQNGRINQNSTGMGLYIVKKLCERLGHGIKVISEYGEYTEYQIAFAENDYYRME